MKNFIRVFVFVAGGVAGFMAEKVMDRLWYKYIEQDPIEELQRSIDDLSASLNEERTKLQEVAYSSDTNLKDNQISSIINHVEIIINGSRELELKFDKLEKLLLNEKKDGELSRQLKKVKPNTEKWLPVGQAISLDEKNTFSVNGRQNNTKYYTSLNGKKQSLSAGDRLEYTGVDGSTCYVSFLGIKDQKYGVSFYCD